MHLRLVPLAAAAAWTVIALTSCGTGSPGSAGHPPVLRLTDAANEGVAMGAPAIGGAGTSAGAFVLRTTLPTQPPAPAPVWAPSRGSRTAAGRVASALALAGVPALRATPVAVSGGWVLRAGTQLLAVRVDGSWTWGLDCSPGSPLEQENLDVMCASAGTGTATPGTATAAPATPGTATAAPATTGKAVSPNARPTNPATPPTSLRPTPPPAVTPTLPPGPPAGAVRPLAATIFGRLGLEGAEQVLVGAPATTATLTPYLATRRTSGWSTSLTFDRHDRQVRLTSASGWVGGATRGAVYPLISARRAFDELQRQPRPMIAMCPVRTDGKPGCAPIPTPAVTGVTIGLALRHDGDRPLLVPAWLFTLAGGGDPEAVVAVDARYLATPTPGVR